MVMDSTVCRFSLVFELVHPSKEPAGLYGFSRIEGFVDSLVTGIWLRPEAPWNSGSAKTIAQQRYLPVV